MDPNIVVKFEAFPLQNEVAIVNPAPLKQKELQATGSGWQISDLLLKSGTHSSQGDAKPAQYRRWPAGSCHAGDGVAEVAVEVL